MQTSERDPGTIFTFYSYKGGVGRTMALANVAALLAKWGHSVLIVDWDLEAPGIDRFFLGTDPSISGQRQSKPGVVDLLSGKATGTEIKWTECIIEAHPFGASSPVAIISAGRSDDTYTKRLQALDFDELFSKNSLGPYLEELRNEWTSAFEFVLIDSRTGITDIGGICTIHLPDVLVLLFTSTDPSVNGVADVLSRSRSQQAHLPFDRGRLLALPVPARDESRTELQRANSWRKIFAERLGEFYKDWLPKGKSAYDALEVLRIPYVPYWSFGEPLPVVEEGTSDPTSLGYAYQMLARFVAAKLEWDRALSGEFLARPVFRTERQWNLKWIEFQRKKAEEGLQKTGWKGFSEIRFFSPNSDITQPQDQLLAAARIATIHTFGWPIGLVLDREDARPRATGEGILTEVISQHSYDYWALTMQLDFYTLMSLFEDFRSKSLIFVDTQIVRTTEALLYCSKLYRRLGAEGSTVVKFGLRYGGLKGRRLGMASRHGLRIGPEKENSYEDGVDTEIVFALEALDKELASLVEKLCSPLFLLFDFTRIPRNVYEQIVEDFRRGIVRQIS
ncbi:MAG TPA: hypothetical protein VGS59_07885 [Candidatus Acidoferrales bacterium]|nr:hypothetical protein [Candidatus Acidoferrales bacterium]